MTSVQAIKKFFEMTATGAMKEIKELDHNERQELGRLACEALGETFEPSAAPVGSTGLSPKTE